ncbi:class I SAM-dependent methyltransferase [Streptomyces formicae]|uniref:Class I SAM-dependent methyltransferase n=1 Tax=Streptomyces formicae TaxID=1616117 RepID=A0ABY3WVQ2_9ACTN|nr:class I SAM-dependent methyltransferase [Streptomyces formicae]UNM15519.1 class I SAM-dependent methyltransferase [Streptomyces formicae]
MTDTLAWDVYAKRSKQRRLVNAAGQTTWFNWTQYPDHGPGAEILAVGPGSTVLELGCGTGGNLAHLTTLGAHALGVDVSTAQLATAKDRWGYMPGLRVERAEAVAYLTEIGEELDAVFSVFGAAWFTDPNVLLPVVRKRLRPGGVFAFSHRPAIEGCYGCQAAYISCSEDQDPLVVKRWDYEPERWVEILSEHGFTGATAEILPAPPGPRTIGTLLVRAQA